MYAACFAMHALADRAPLAQHKDARAACAGCREHGATWLRMHARVPKVAASTQPRGCSSCARATARVPHAMQTPQLAGACTGWPLLCRSTAQRAAAQALASSGPNPSPVASKPPRTLAFRPGPCTTLLSSGKLSPTLPARSTVKQLPRPLPSRPAPPQDRGRSVCGLAGVCIAKAAGRRDRCCHHMHERQHLLLFIGLPTAARADAHAPPCPGQHCRSRNLPGRQALTTRREGHAPRPSCQSYAIERSWPRRPWRCCFPVASCACMPRFKYLQ